MESVARYVNECNDGTLAHCETVLGLLDKGGFSAEHLQCGPHAPFDRETALAIARTGGKPQRIHNRIR